MVDPPFSVTPRADRVPAFTEAVSEGDPAFVDAVEAHAGRQFAPSLPVTVFGSILSVDLGIHRPDPVFAVENPRAGSGPFASCARRRRGNGLRSY